jgi:hypothetical protein
MRVLLFVMLAIVCTKAGAQDYCSRIKKEMSPDRTIYDYSSPFDVSDPPSLRVTRSYGTNPDFATDNFFVIFQVTGDLETIYKNTDTGQIEKDEVKLVVEFDDKTKLVEDTVKIGHDFTSDRTQAIRYVFYSLTDKTVKDFTTKKIAKFSLAGFEQTVAPDSAVAIQHYVECLKAVKKD